MRDSDKVALLVCYIALLRRTTRLGLSIGLCSLVRLSHRPMRQNQAQFNGSSREEP